ncbi:peptidase U32 [Gracilaria domingensis]|nr:peptidase U32 [Gracilaria domingensis]
MTHPKQSKRPPGTSRRNTSEDDRRRNAISHQREVLKTYVRLALQKAVDCRKPKVRLKSPTEKNDEQLVQEWLRQIHRGKEKNNSPLRREGEESMIIRALDSLDPHPGKYSEKMLIVHARRLSTIVPELPDLCRMLEKASTLSIKQVKYGEMETARAMAWHSYGRKMPSADILSRAYDLVEFESGRKVQSRPKKHMKKDKRILRKRKEADSMDEILAMSLVEQTDRVMYSVKGTGLYSDQSTAVCKLDEFVGEVTRCAIWLNPCLLRIVQKCIAANMDKDEMVFGLERNKRLINIIWGDSDKLEECLKCTGCDTLSRETGRRVHEIGRELQELRVHEGRGADEEGAAVAGDDARVPDGVVHGGGDGGDGGGVREGGDGRVGGVPGGGLAGDAGDGRDAGVGVAVHVEPDAADPQRDPRVQGGAQHRGPAEQLVPAAVRDARAGEEEGGAGGALPHVAGRRGLRREPAGHRRVLLGQGPLPAVRRQGHPAGPPEPRHAVRRLLPGAAAGRGRARGDPPRRPPARGRHLRGARHRRVARHAQRHARGRRLTERGARRGAARRRRCHWLSHMRLTQVT